MVRFVSGTSQPTSTALSRRSLLLAATAAAGSLGMPASLFAKTLALRVNYFGDYTPYSYLKADSSMTGIFIDALNDVLGRRGAVALTHRGLPWARAQQEVKEGEADAFCTLASDARKEYANFSQEALYSIGPVLCFAKNNPQADKIRKVTTLEGLGAFSVGTYIGDSRVGTAFKGLNINTVPDVKQVLLKIEAGRSDLTVINIPTLAVVTRNLGIRDKFDTVPFNGLPADSYHLGIRKTYADGPEILALFDKLVVAARTDKTLEKILASYSS